jgi:V8-like Glu-specific endopeptidase
VLDDKLKKLYEMQDYGEYAISQNSNTNSGLNIVENSAKRKMPVCFIATNHTTGGNSGSPVLNARGELIGLNFDRNWEGTMSDINYDVNYCRNITLDIRYVLFIIDKFAGCERLIREVKTDK